MFTSDEDRGYDTDLFGLMINQAEKYELVVKVLKATVATVLVLSLSVLAVLPILVSLHATVTEIPTNPDPHIFPPPPSDPPRETHGWKTGHMSDMAKDCQKPGHGRPWCA